MSSNIRLTVVMLVVALAGMQVQAQDAPQPPPPGSGFLGGKFLPINDEVAEELGIEVQDGVVAIEIIEDSPAHKAGLKEKDIVKKIDDKAVDGVETFRAIMFATTPGQTLKLLVVRDKQEQEISVTLGERPEKMPTTRPG